VADQSGLEHIAAFNGTPAIVPDDMFGSCIHFDGATNFIELDSPVVVEGNQATWALWVRPKADGVICHNQQIEIKRVENSFVCSVHQNGAWKSIASADTCPPERWYHIALVWDGVKSILRLFINGDLDNDIPVDAADLSTAAEANLIIGAGFDKTNFFTGQIGHFRVYQQVMIQNLIRKFMAQDQNALSAFKVEYPIEFNLLDDEERNIFYISESTQVNVFQLELENTSVWNLMVGAVDNKIPSKENYHFELKFKPKTFQEHLDDNDKYVKYRIL
ncbi:MAG: LamG domain-containing protein, partial [Planctomycetes bacterium]|nr:LamG domain-containing protein [Planctomycetota bacterium]